MTSHPADFRLVTSDRHFVWLKQTKLNVAKYEKFADLIPLILAHFSFLYRVQMYVYLESLISHARSRYEWKIPIWDVKQAHSRVKCISGVPILDS